MNKKWLSLLLVCILTLAIFTGCSDSEAEVGEDLPELQSQESGDGSDFEYDEDYEYYEDDVDFASSLYSNENFDSDFHTVDGNVTGIAVNQGLSYGVDQATGSYYFMNSFVEQRKTVIFVTLAQAETIDYTGQTQFMKMYRDGELVAYLAPDTGNITSEKMLGFAFVDETFKSLTAGNYTIEVQTQSGSGTRNITLRSTPKMTVLAVPFHGILNGEYVYPADGWQTAGAYTAESYPLSYDDFEYVISPPIDLTDPMYDMGSKDGQYNVWKALNSMQTQAGDYTMIVGFTQGGLGPEGRIMGYTYGTPSSIVSMDSAALGTVVAHEIAHCYLVGDEYQGGSMSFGVNIAPYGYSGRNMASNNGETITATTEFIRPGEEYGAPGSGSPIKFEQMPYNWDKMVHYSAGSYPATSFMGWNVPNTTWQDVWITSAIWERLYEVFTGANEETVASGEMDSNHIQCPECGVAFAPEEAYWLAICEDAWEFTYVDYDATTFICDAYGDEHDITIENLYTLCPDEGCQSLISAYDIVAQSSAQQSSMLSGMSSGEATDEILYLIDIRGEISPNGFNADPFYEYEGERSYLTQPKNGDYRIEIVDSDGTVVSQLKMQPDKYAASDPPILLEEPLIDVTMTMPETAVSIDFYYLDELIHSMPVSENIPEVQFTNEFPVELDGEITLTFEGIDADGDDLYYEIWYQDYEETVQFIGSDIAETEFVVKTDDLPGTDAGYFVIYVTDGINTNYNFSDDFAVQYKAPEVLAIPEAREYLITEDILIDVDIYDMQDGWLMDDHQVTWYDEGGKEVQTSSMLMFFPFELTPGKTYSYTFEATNSQGISITDEVQFSISEDTDLLPDAWYTDAIEFTLSAGYILSYDDAENTPLNRIDLARGLFMMDAYFSDSEDIPDYDDTLFTDVPENLDQYSAFYAVQLGYLDAPDGIFDPYGIVTEQEAMDAFYKILENTVPEATSEYDSSTDLFIDFAVLDDIPENVYEPDVDMSRAKMFYRFYSLISLILE